MNTSSLVFALILGALGILQGALNKKIVPALGLGGATLINACVFVVLATGVVLSGVLPWQGKWADVKLWYLVPGVMGFCFVVGIPFCMARMGALNTYLWLIASQIAVGAAWDTWVDGQEMSVKRIAGSALALLGSYLATRS